MDSPFLRMDDPSYPEILADGAVHVLGGQGIDRFSVRALARWMKVSPAALLNDYSRARILEIIVITFERRWLAWSGSDPMFGPSPAVVPLRLPATPDEALGVRVYSALDHLAEAERLRENAAPATHLERLRREEIELLRFRMEGMVRRCCHGTPSDAEVLVTMALVTGLRLALAEPQPALDWSMACGLLKDHLTRLIGHAPQCAATPEAS